MATEIADNIYLSIIVFTGVPHDFMKYRHVGIQCLLSEQQWVTFFHVEGAPQRFLIQELPNYDGTQSQRFAKQVNVGYLQVPMTLSQLRELMFSMEPDNSSAEYNCQNWVGMALEKLVSSNYLTQQEVSDAIDDMAAAILEATQEDQAA